MERILITGCGDIARRAIPHLTRRYRVYALVRNPAYCEPLRKLGAIPVIGDLDDRQSLSRIKGLADAVLHFAPPAPNGTTDTRTRNLLSVLSAGSGPNRLVYISTSGVYGDCHDAHINETSAVNPASMRGKLRVDAERRIRAWARANSVNANILRVPGIYAAERLPLDRLKSGAPVMNAHEDSYSNHIHAEDLARIAVAALLRGKPCRIYHATDDDEMKMGDYFDAVADAHTLPRAPRLSRAEVKTAVSPMMWSFMNESRRLSNTRMKLELKVVLRYPTLNAFFNT
ncbi:MAG TPA: NAD(P)-dependent oxidoreductase [Gallionella sp.]|nr:MAG: NAD(P)-dependent oxidoreductase [Gallionellales bacterium GWA2_54_124]OGT17824.1 MAG: NAD(P)-dependent oxidoreductase [Gallionellales bacterium RIFOXYD12_FULL_53_10]HCI53887.1 NAD(P)-dependent oxidoreductase [Gallionella sp.]